MAEGEGAGDPAHLPAELGVAVGRVGLVAEDEDNQDEPPCESGQNHDQNLVMGPEFTN